MREFKDKAGKMWQIDITIGKLKRIREIAGCDLIDPNSEGYRKWAQDTILQAETLAAAVNLGEMSAEDFLERLKMEHIIDGVVAMLSSYADFYPEQQGRALMLAVAAMEQERKLIDQRLSEKLSDGSIQELLDREIQNARPTKAI